ncbi:MAG: nucleotidyltransferase family protein [Gammaproteobacteria bacterium]|nr:nucleotidyltransferase family protein [Gammaproteobacteria bacterium]MCW8922198.1 nucleotidyltransferase family protein [Gammaproteobacteria bacterium]
MKAMILAAGRGERLRPLTDHTPKPLLKVDDKSLIEYHLYRLAQAGIKDVVINTAWLGAQIQQTLGNGEKYNLTIHYSDEGNQALETAGGIIRALPLLGDEPFLIINGDIYTDYDFKPLTELKLNSEAHLVMVKNPDHNHQGDFALENNQIKNNSEPLYTYSGIGIYTKEFFAGIAEGVVALAPILKEKIEQKKVSGELHTGAWTDVGTKERLQQLNNK